MAYRENLAPPGATDVTAATVVKTTAHTFDPEGRMTAMIIKDAAGNSMVTQSWTCLQSAEASIWRVAKDSG